MLRILLYEDHSNPYCNVAFDEALLNNVKPRQDIIVLRIWRNPTSIVVGANSSVQDEVRIDVVRRMRIPLIQRFTGGGAVYHDLGNINYTIIVSMNKSCETRGIDYIYGDLLKTVLRALRMLGVDSIRIANRSDIVVGDYKVSGNAGVLRRNGCLLHGTLLLDSDLDTMHRLLIIPPHNARNDIDPVKYRAGNLTSILGREMSTSDIIASLVDSVSRLPQASREVLFDMPGEEELNLAKNLCSRYMIM